MRKLLSLVTSFFLATVAVAESDISDVRALEERFKKMDFVAEMQRFKPRMSHDIHDREELLPISSGRILFLSFSMPRSMLQDYIRQGQAMGARVIFRGFKDDSFQATVAYAAELFESEDDNQEGGFDIDPELFAAYRVTAVPAFVERDDIVRGAITSAYAYDYMDKRRQP